MRVLVPVEIGRERLPLKCIAAFPDSIKCIPYRFEGPMIATDLACALVDSEAEGFFTCRPRGSLGHEAMAAVRRHVRRSVFWYMEGPTTYAREAPSDLSQLAYFDHGFAVSQEVANALTAHGVNCEFMPPAIDDIGANYQPTVGAPRHVLGFVGIPKGVRIAIVLRLLDAGLPIEVVGPGWDKYLPPVYVPHEVLWDTKLYDYYASIHAAFNIDEWFPSSTSGIGLRIFEVLAAGTSCLTNPIDELTACFGDDLRSVQVWHDFEDLERLARRVLSAPHQRWDTRELLTPHTFRRRMALVAEVLIER